MRRARPRPIRVRILLVATALITGIPSLGSAAIPEPILTSSWTECRTEHLTILSDASSGQGEGLSEGGLHPIVRLTEGMDLTR